MGPQSRAQALRRWALRAVFATWIAACMLAVTSLAVAHWYSLPRPARDNPVLARALASHAAAAPRPSWAVTHVLYGFCRCSRRVVAHLAARGPLADAREHVILAGPADDLSASLQRRGFALTQIAPHALKTAYGLETAPLLIVSSPDGVVRYLGGYSERKQGPALRDREIFASLRRGHEIAELPLFGCAVSRALQDMLDPFGLKYAQRTR